MDVIGSLFGLALIALILGIAYVFIDEIVVPFVPAVIFAPISILVVTKIWRAGHDNVAVLVAIVFGAVAYVFQNHWFDYLGEIRSKAKYKCPKCGSAETVNHDSKTDTYSTTRTETHRTTHFDKDGEERGYSEHDVEVPYTTEAVTLYMRCEKCSHDWTVTNGHETKTPGGITFTALVAIVAAVVIAHYVLEEWQESGLPSTPNLSAKQKVSVTPGQQKPPAQKVIRSAAKPPVGNWSGSVNQPGYGSFLVTMKLSGVDGGSVDYPSLGCGGSLSFTGERNGSFYYTARITYGKNKCINGRVKVRPSGDAVYYEWSDGKSKASGTLRMASANSIPEQQSPSGQNAKGRRTDIPSEIISAFNDKYVAEKGYKAFAIAVDSNSRYRWAYSSEKESQNEAIIKAVSMCRRSAETHNIRSHCKLYAVGDEIVY